MLSVDTERLWRYNVRRRVAIPCVSKGQSGRLVLVEDFIAAEDIVRWSVEILGGEGMRGERVALSFSRKTSVSISALWTAWKGLEARGRVVGGRNGRGEVGDDPPGGSSCTNDAEALTSLARRSAKEFAVEWRLEIRVDSRHIICPKQIS